MDAPGPLFCVVQDGAVAAEHGGEDTVPWWSFTKTLIAAAVLRLAAAGEVQLDAPLPGSDATPRRLLRHEAGLPDYGPLKAYHQAVARGETPWSFEQVRAAAAETGPVTAWTYSNIGYRLLRDLIEARRGPEGLAQLVLAPLGLESARLAVSPADLDGVEMGQARSYHPGWVYHGLVVGSVREAALALDRLPGLVGSQAWTQMGRSVDLPQHTRRPWAMAAYGLGLMAPRLADGRIMLGHTGGGPGSEIAVYRHAMRSVAVFGLEGSGVGIEAAAVDLLTGP